MHTLRCHPHTLTPSHPHTVTTVLSASFGNFMAVPSLVSLFLLVGHTQQLFRCGSCTLIKPHMITFHTLTPSHIGIEESDQEDICRWCPHVHARGDYTGLFCAVWRGTWRGGRKGAIGRTERQQKGGGSDVESPNQLFLLQ